MESDSDSKGSHISATPPASPSAPPPNLLARKPILLPKTQSEVRTEPPPSHQNYKSKCKSTGLPASVQQNHGDREKEKDSSFSLFPEPIFLPSFPLPSRNCIAHGRSSADRPSSGETLAAGSRYFSLSSSFARIGERRTINFNSDENESEDRVTERTLDARAEKSDDMVQLQKSVVEGVSRFGSEKRVKRPSNLIGAAGSSSAGAGSLLPMKRPKNINEGNFVKLNIGGRGRWSKNKCQKNRKYRFSQSHRKGLKRYGAEQDGVDEEVFVRRSTSQDTKEVHSSNFDKLLIEQGISEVRKEASDDNLLKLLKLTHGYDSYHDGQLEAIKMIVAGKSTMLVLPTGAGKSLCYQLPAIVLPGITLVISPLVALMIDQLKHLPPVISGAILCSNQSLEEVSETLQLLQEGAIKVLFVSPERLLNEEFISLVSSSCTVSLMVVDEAHCISEWSHNFRPSYMRLRHSVLRHKLDIGCVLAMSATATTRTLNVIMSALDIPLGNLVRRSHVRGNLQLSLSLSEKKMKDLVQILRTSPFSDIKSIIIYCKFQYETDLVSKYLCDSNIPAKSYHSGIQAKNRSRIQALFCSNKLRVVVATVAFGMGVDKSDIGAVIHYSLPDSLEEYVQEIGRAGRDGRLSYCHLLVDDLTYFKLRSLTFSDGVDEYAVNKFLTQVFGGGTEVVGKSHSLIMESTSRKFDIKEEVILTILTQLELGKTQYLSVLPQINVTCCLSFHKTPRLELARKNLVIAVILKRSDSKHGLHVFDVTTAANNSGLTTKDVLEELKNLKFMGEISYELKDPAFCYTIMKMPGDVCSLAAEITDWLSEVESSKVRRLDVMFSAALNALRRCDGTQGCHGEQHTACLQKRISDYFNEENVNDTATTIMQNSSFLRADIKVFLQSNSHVKFTPRAVARIMHGIGSPAYPSLSWSKAHFWGRYSNVDFNAVMAAAQAELIACSSKKLRQHSSEELLQIWSEAHAPDTSNTNAPSNCNSSSPPCKTDLFKCDKPYTFLESPKGDRHDS